MSESVNEYRDIQLVAGVKLESFARLSVALAKLDVVRSVLSIDVIRESLDYFEGTFGRKTVNISRSRTLSLHAAGLLDDQFTGGFTIAEKQIPRFNTHKIDAFQSGCQDVHEADGITTCYTPQTILTMQEGTNGLDRFVANTNAAFRFIVERTAEYQLPDSAVALATWRGGVEA